MRISYEELFQVLERILLTHGVSRENAREAADAGCIGLCWTNTKPNTPRLGRGSQQGAGRPCFG